MMSKAATVAEYLASLPEDRRTALEALRKVIRRNLDKGFAEGMQYGMIGYYVPHKLYPSGYHCDPTQPLPFAGMASQKNHMSFYLGCLYGIPEHEKHFRAEWAETGKKLDMGKACIRFKKLEDLPLEVIGRTVARITAKQWIEYYEKTRESSGKKRARAKTISGTKAGPRQVKAAGKTRKVAPAPRTARTAKAGAKRKA